jgi:hypothetical protein
VRGRDMSVKLVLIDDKTGIERDESSVALGDLNQDTQLFETVRDMMLNARKYL